MSRPGSKLCRPLPFIRLPLLPPPPPPTPSFWKKTILLNKDPRRFLKTTAWFNNTVPRQSSINMCNNCNNCKKVLRRRQIWLNWWNNTHCCIPPMLWRQWRGLLLPWMPNPWPRCWNKRRPRCNKCWTIHPRTSVPWPPLVPVVPIFVRSNHPTKSTSTFTIIYCAFRKKEWRTVRNSATATKPTETTFCDDDKSWNTSFMCGTRPRPMSRSAKSRCLRWYRWWVSHRHRTTFPWRACPTFPWSFHPSLICPKKTNVCVSVRTREDVLGRKKHPIPLKFLTVKPFTVPKTWRFPKKTMWRWLRYAFATTNTKVKIVGLKNAPTSVPTMAIVWTGNACAMTVGTVRLVVLKKMKTVPTSNVVVRWKKHWTTVWNTLVIEQTAVTTAVPLMVQLVPIPTVPWACTGTRPLPIPRLTNPSNPKKEPTKSWWWPNTWGWKVLKIRNWKNKCKNCKTEAWSTKTRWWCNVFKRAKWKKQKKKKYVRSWNNKKKAKRKLSVTHGWPTKTMWKNEKKKLKKLNNQTFDVWKRLVCWTNGRPWKALCWATTLWGWCRTWSFVTNVTVLIFTRCPEKKFHPRRKKQLMPTNIWKACTMVLPRTSTPWNWNNICGLLWQNVKVWWNLNMTPPTKKNGKDRKEANWTHRTSNILCQNYLETRPTYGMIIFQDWAALWFKTLVVFTPVPKALLIPWRPENWTWPMISIMRTNTHVWQHIFWRMLLPCKNNIHRAWNCNVWWTTAEFCPRCSRWKQRQPRRNTKWRLFCPTAIVPKSRPITAAIMPMPLKSFVEWKTKETSTIRNTKNPSKHWKKVCAIPCAWWTIPKRYMNRTTEHCMTKRNVICKGKKNFGNDCTVNKAICTRRNSNGCLVWWGTAPLLPPRGFVLCVKKTPTNMPILFLVL